MGPSHLAEFLSVSSLSTVTFPISFSLRLQPPGPSRKFTHRLFRLVGITSIIRNDFSLQMLDAAEFISQLLRPLFRDLRGLKIPQFNEVALERIRCRYRQIRPEQIWTGMPPSGQTALQLWLRLNPKSVLAPCSRSRHARERRNF